MNIWSWFFLAEERKTWRGNVAYLKSSILFYCRWKWLRNWWESGWRLGRVGGSAGGLRHGGGVAPREIRGVFAGCTPAVVAAWSWPCQRNRIDGQALSQRLQGRLQPGQCERLLQQHTLHLLCGLWTRNHDGNVDGWIYSLMSCLISPFYDISRSCGGHKI